MRSKEEQRESVILKRSGVSPINQKVMITEATEDDIPILVGFLGELFALEKDFRPNPKLQEAAIKTILQNPMHATIYVIRVDKVIAGMAVLHLSISTAEGGWSGRIEDVYVKSEFRHKGIGRRLIKEIIAIAAAQGLTRVMLSADKDNFPAHSFYISCGFKEMNLLSFIAHPNTR